MKVGMNIVEFLLARIEEDAAVARAAIGSAALSEQTGRWKAVDVPDEYGARPYVMAVAASGACTQVANMEAAWERDERAAHIARHDPARVLTDCAAKRELIEELHHEYQGVCPHCVDVSGPHQREPWPCLTVRLAALPYAGHPEYRDEWRAPYLECPKRHEEEQEPL